MANLINLYPQDALHSAILQSNRPVSVLIGSPLSMSDLPKAPGVPSVQGILDIVQEHVRNKGIEPQYQKDIGQLSGAARYQKAISFVLAWIGQDAVNQIIQKAVLNARIHQNDTKSLKDLDMDIDGWYLPRGIKALGEIFTQGEHFRGPILTTNFDPLMAVSIKVGGGMPSQTVLHSDGSLGQHRVMDEGVREIIHLHGYWQDSDTLHTPEQLTAYRPKLKASLSRLLSETTLLIIGYGGWDDIFLSALRDLMADDRASLDVLWAFHETDPQTVSEKYRNLLTEMAPAITRGRFRPYGGIECNAFLHDLAKSVAKTQSALTSTAKGKGDHEPTKKKANLDPTEQDISSPEIVKNEYILDGDDANLPDIRQFKEWRPPLAPHHHHVRAVEQAQLLEILNTSRTAYLAADWGLGKEGFLAAVLRPDDSISGGDPLYRLDIEGVSDRDGLLATMEEQLGVPLQVFALAASKLEQFTLILDGAGLGTAAGTMQTWQQSITDVISALVDFLPKIRVVVVGRRELPGLNYPSVRLTPLDEADVSNYIQNHVEDSFDLADDKSLDILFRLSRGMPMQLDRLLADLSIISIDELLEAETDYTGCTEENTEPIPVALERAVARVAGSNDDHLLRCNHLLKVLTVLAFGEPLRNIKYFINARPFHPSHVRELRDLGLLETSSSASHSPLTATTPSQAARETDIKILTIPPQVREYVIGRIDPGEVDEIVNRAAELTFGQNWRQGKIKLNASEREHLHDQTRTGAGNPHLLSIHLLRQAIKNNDESLALCAFNVGLSYCKLLQKYIRYRDASAAASELLHLTTDGPFDFAVEKLQKLYGTVLRMVGRHKEAIIQLEKSIPKLIESDKPSIADAYINLALAQKSDGDTCAAIQAAKQAKDFSKVRDSQYLQASAMLIECEENDDKTESLIRLERRARKSKSYVVANNILLTLARKETTLKNKIKFYEKVINGPPDEYNQIISVVSKGKLFAEEGMLGELLGSEERLLRRAYSFSFTQRFSSIFNDSHEILWLQLETRDNRSGLYHLFRYSSLIWRLRGDLSREQEYAKRLKNFLKNTRSKQTEESVALSSVARYVTYRVRLIFEV